MDKNFTIVLVEDDWMVSIGITDYLSAAGFKVVETGSADAALGFLKHQANIEGATFQDGARSGTRPDMPNRDRMASGGQ